MYFRHLCNDQISFIFIYLVLPRVQPFSFGDVPLFLGESATVQCSINSGDVPVRFSWIFNGKPIDETAGYNIGKFGKKASVLSIDAVSEQHSGNYTCLASNNAGIASYMAELIVKGICDKYFFLTSSLLQTSKLS